MMPLEIRIAWRAIRALFMTMSDLAFGTGLAWLVLALWKSRPLGQWDVEASLLLLVVYLLNRLALFLRIMGVPATQRDTTMPERETR